LWVQVLLSMVGPYRKLKLDFAARVGCRAKLEQSSDTSQLLALSLLKRLQGLGLGYPHFVVLRRWLKVRCLLLYCSVQALSLDREEVESLLIDLILNKRIHGYIDQVSLPPCSPSRR
jgi:hypothetical protein